MSNPHIKISQGEIKGKAAITINRKNYYSFQGIPYAEPPIGDLRFKAPIPIKRWTGVKDATKEGNVAMQITEQAAGILATTSKADENCLFLNVHTPSLPDNKTNQYPVLVYFHHGGFIGGSGNSSTFGPDLFIENGVVFVSINYRLGALGFLCLHTKEVPGNAGLKDQNLALKWIKQNIAAFNGDPNNVTIMGVSAGSASVEYHILSHLSRGLFHKAIMMSGTCLNPWARTKDPVKLAFQIAASLGCSAETVDDLHKFYMKVDARAVIDVAVNIPFSDASKKTGEYFLFTPVIEQKFDGVEPFMVEDPLEMLKNGNFSKVPTVSGFGDEEGASVVSYFGASLAEMKNGNYENSLPDYFKKPDFNDKLRQVYVPKKDDKNEDEPTISFLSDLMMVGGMYTSLINRSRYNNEEYAYMFVYDSEVNNMKTFFNLDVKGACHGDDISFLAPTEYIDEAKFTPKDTLLRKRMVEMWTNFIKTSNPTPVNSKLVDIKWFPVSKDDVNYLEIGEEFVMKKNPIPERTKLWLKLYS